MSLPDLLSRCGRRFLVLSLALVLLPSWSAVGPLPVAAAVAVQEDDKRAQVKAALMFRFLRYTRWPKEIEKAGQLKIAVVGEWEDDKILRSSLKKLETRDLKVTVEFLDLAKTPEAERAELLAPFHALLFGVLDPKITAKTLESVRGKPVLTVAEEDKAVRPRSVLELYLEKGRYRIRACLDLAKAGQLLLDPQLLDLAEIVPERER